MCIHIHVWGLQQDADYYHHLAEQDSEVEVPLIEG